MPVIGLVGWRGGGLDWAAVRARGPEEMSDGAPGPEPVEVWRGRHLGGVERGAVRAPVNTLDNLWIEWQAGRLRALQPETAPYLSGARGAAWRESLTEKLAAPEAP